MRRPIIRAIPAQTRNFFRRFNFLYIDISWFSFITQFSLCQMKQHLCPYRRRTFGLAIIPDYNSHAANSTVSRISPANLHCCNKLKHVCFRCSKHPVIILRRAIRYLFHSITSSSVPIISNNILELLPFVLINSPYWSLEGRLFSSSIFNFSRSLVTASASSANIWSDMSGSWYNVKINSLPSLLGNTRMGL